MIVPSAFENSLQELDGFENGLINVRDELLQYLQEEKSGEPTPEEDKNNQEIVKKGIAFIGKAVVWADKVTDEAADVPRIKGVLDWVQQQQAILVKYTGDKLTETIKDLSLTTLEITQSLEDLYFLSDMVKIKTEDTKAYIMMQDELTEGAAMTNLTDD